MGWESIFVDDLQGAQFGGPQLVGHVAGQMYGASEIGKSIGPKSIFFTRDLL